MRGAISSNSGRKATVGVHPTGRDCLSGRSRSRQFRMQEFRLRTNGPFAEQGKGMSQKQKQRQFFLC